MTTQQDLFLCKPWESSIEEKRGWERRAILDLERGPVVACYPGFMGSVYERLVAKGLARRDDAGFMVPPDPTGMMENGKIISPKRADQITKEYWTDPFPQFRYSLVERSACRG